MSNQKNPSAISKLVTVNQMEAAERLLYHLGDTQRGAVLFIGPPGCGKSELVSSCAERADLPHWTIYPALMEPTDITGIPYASNGVASFLPVGVFGQIVKADAGVLFIDEIGQASDAVQKALMSLILARRVGDHTLSRDIRIVAASNRPTDKAGVGGLLSTLASRFGGIYELKPTAKAWLEWAKTAGVHPFVRQWINSEPRWLEEEHHHGIGFAEPYPCARSITQMAKHFEAHAAGVIDPVMFTDIAMSCIGKEAAGSFNVFVSARKSLATPDEILNDPLGARVQTTPNLVKMQIALCTGKVDASNISQIAAYMGRYDAEHRRMFRASVAEHKPYLAEHKALADF